MKTYTGAELQNLGLSLGDKVVCISTHSHVYKEGGVYTVVKSCVPGYIALRSPYGGSYNGRSGIWGIPKLSPVNLGDYA